jgi:hypothetical protein
MKIIIGGMGLSGSTLCYNIFRIISERRGYKTPQKIHEWNHAALKGKTIFMVRDLRDTVASMLRKDPDHWKGDVEKATMYQMMWYYDSWKGKDKNFVWKYEDYKDNPYEYAKAACDTVGIPITIEEITEIVDEAENIKNLNIPSHQNSLITKEEVNLWWSTKLSKRHITNDGKIGGYRNILSDDDVKFIETKYRYFFDQQNYQLEYE